MIIYIYIYTHICIYIYTYIYSIHSYVYIILHYDLPFIDPELQEPVISCDGITVHCFIITEAQAYKVQLPNPCRPFISRLAWNAITYPLLI